MRGAANAINRIFASYEVRKANSGDSPEELTVRSAG
jgi:hypothetical protein